MQRSMWRVLGVDGASSNSKKKMIQDIDDFVVTDENVWGGYVCAIATLLSRVFGVVDLYGQPPLLF